MPADTTIAINVDKDVVMARQEGRALAIGAGFSASQATLIATAISELSRNIVSYANHGTITLRLMRSAGRIGLTIVAADNGRGIGDIGQALRDGYSTSGGLGLGLPGVRRLMDEFEITSAVGSGTRITVTKWR